MEVALSYLLPLVAVVVLHAALRRRARRRAGSDPARLRVDQARWLGLVLGCALVVAVLDLLA